MIEQSIPVFQSGIHNILNDEIIPKDAAQSSLNWLTRDGKIELIYGRQSIGGNGAAGKNYGEWTGYKANGTAVRFRKVGTAVQYLNGTTWTDVITGLTVGDVTFANYQSLAGAFTYIFSLDGIYKIATANPSVYADMYQSTKNFKGYGLIDRGRSILWGRNEDPTGLYGSYIDAQTSVVYTTVAGEAVAAVESGTLAFKAGGARRTCFGVVITDTSSSEVFTDNYNGVLTGSAGGSGTINYMTGAFTITGQTGAGTASYQWEDSNVKGVTDFTKSATRLASEGFVIRQDAGGDAIRTVIVSDGSYFSIKKNSVYQLTLDTTDLSPVNILFRTDIGVNSLRSAVGTGAGIVFMNTANPSKPSLNIIQRNTFGDNFDVKPLFPHFKWENFAYDDVMVDSWDKYVLVGCQYDSDENNRLLLADIQSKTVDITYYGVRTVTKNGGYLYGGDPVSKTTYELFTGFDDNTLAISNEWVSKGEVFGSDTLKKEKRLRFSGLIDPNQSIAVYVSPDDADYHLVGTIVGSGDYVNYNTTYAVGTTIVGTGTIGGDDTVSVYRFLMDIKLQGVKFRKRTIKLVAMGIGYCSLESITDRDIRRFENRLPKVNRTKQNVSLDGTVTNEDNPTY